MPEFLEKRTSVALQILCSACFLASPLLGGVSKEIQNGYVQTYENRAMYLKIPIHGARQIVFVQRAGANLDTSGMGQIALFKVGDQVRITDVEFKNRYVRFKLSSVERTKLSELHFLFPQELTNLFPQKPYFDEALNYALTQGQSYRDIEAARESFVENQFDRLLDQFAGTAGISRDQLVRRIAEESSDLQQSRAELAERSSELKRQQKMLADEESLTETLTQENRTLQRQVREAETGADSLKEERLDLLDERDLLKKRIAQIESEQAEGQRRTMQYEQQVDDLIRNLDLQNDSSSELGNKVASLSDVISTLKQEESELSGKLSESGRRVADLLDQNTSLQEEVRKLKNQKARLDSNLKVLTTGKNSVNKTLLEVQQERDNLSAARSLQAALKWNQQTLAPGLENQGMAVISLHDHKIAEFELEAPQTVDRPYTFALRLESPDLVKFNEEERALYEQLGEKLTVETSWKTPQGIQSSLVEGDSSQEVAPRGQATWSWSFSGNLENPQPVILALTLKDVNGIELQLAEREFVLRSAGFLARVSDTFSLWSLLIGLAGGLSIVLFMRRRPKPEKKAPPHPVEYMAKKRL